MSKKGYREKRDEYYKSYFKELQKEIKSISTSQIIYRFLKEIKEIKELMEDIFDTPFWECFLEDNAIEKCLSKKETFVLFEIKNMPCGLALVSDIQESNKREIYNLDVEDELFLRGNGLGEKIVKLLKEKIYPSENLYGYAVSESAKFWSRQASSYDHKVFNSMKEEHIQNGGKEDELFESEGLMYFSL